MSSFNKNEQKLNIRDENNSSDTDSSNLNEIKLIKRTLENNTHEVYEDKRLKTITTWRKSKSKFYKILIFNILTFGILHWISLHYPNLYIKLYCNPSSAKDCDFFLVENIYGQYTLCIKNYKKSKNKALNINSDYSEENIIASSIINNNKAEYICKNLTYSFQYKSMNYEYNLETNLIIPVYMDLSKMTNKSIINCFGEGLSSQNIVNKFEARFGKNEYYINPKLLHLYFKKVEFPGYIIIFIIGLGELFLKDYISFIIKIVIIILIFLKEYIYIKKIAYNIYKKENTLDGEKKIRVKRKYLSNDKTNCYYEIDNKDLLPGDILYLKTNDIVPCDCLIIEGKCIVNQSNSTGNLNILKKESLINNNEEFNYQTNKNNILLHGMKIINVYSKLKEKYISVLCINTGPNTFKANQYSNILYFSERKKEYNDIYRFFGDDRKTIIIIIIILFFLSMLLGIGYIYTLKMNIDMKILKNLIITCIFRTLFKSMMSVYFFTHSIILIKSLYNLQKRNIICYDKCRLLYSYNINTIFFSTTNIISESFYTINTYNPAYIGNHRSNNIIYKSFNEYQYKEMNNELFNYYKEYISKNQITDFNSKNIRKAIIKNKQTSDKSNNYTVLFLECLLSSNNLEKINNEIFGNNLEIKIFNQMKWDIKSYDYNYNEEDNNEIKNNDYSEFNTSSNKYKFSSDNKNYYIDRKINDIFPKNYYKITESIKVGRRKQKKLEQSHKLKQLISKKNIHTSKKDLNDNLLIDDNIKINQIIEDIINSHINSYKIRVYKRFIKDGSLTSSAIVYNFITNELRFMTKGIPEDILNNCNDNSLPENFEKIISLIRMNGYNIIVCATKLLNIEEYNDLNSINYYMNNLIFCGFITLKRDLKNGVYNSINVLKQLECDLIISSGDHIYNCLSSGFKSGIVEKNKNIFNISKDDNDKIIINKVYSSKNINLKEIENEDEKITNNSNDLYSKCSKKTSKPKNDSNNENTNNQKQQLRKNIRKIPLSKNSSIEDNDKNLFTQSLYHRNESDNSRNKKRARVEENLKMANIEINGTKKFKNKNKNIQKIPSLNLSNDSEKKRINQTNDSESRNINQKKVSIELKNQRSKNSQKNKISKRRKTNFEIYLEKHFFYPRIFNDYDELNSNCIYCISGKAFNYLYNNKNKKQYKYLLEQILKYSKIFYDMSSINKSFLVEFYREYKKSCICYLGKSESDSDAILTANIGICLEEPKNQNTILSHFYISQPDILCIKNLILEGRAIHENIIFLKLASIFCTMVIVSYIICCFICHIDANIGQLNFLEISLIIFSMVVFTEKSNNKIKLNHFILKPKLFVCFYISQFIGVFLLKLINIYLISKNYNNGPIDDYKEKSKIFCTFYFMLCLELLFSSIFIFNYNSFYRKYLSQNKVFIFISLIFAFYLILLLTLNSSNYNYDLFNINHFEFLRDLVDSYSDRNKFLTFIVFMLDIGSSYIYSRIIYFIFDKCLTKNKNNYNSKIL